MRRLTTKTLKNSSDDLNFNENKKMPQPNEWLNHFETLHSEHHLNKEQNEIIDCLKNYEKVKDNLIISSIETLSKCFLKVFNNVLISGRFPESWREGLITPIHKSGNFLDPNNY